MLRRSISKSIFTTAAAISVVAGFVCLFVLGADASSAHAYTSPGKPAGYVNDFASVLPAAARASLEAKLTGLEQSTGVEVVVATVPSLGGDTVENYAVQLFKEWGIGNKEKDNGLLILVAPADHQARIEVGYGLEPVVTDLVAGRIIEDDMKPAFRKDDYAGGISAAVDAVTAIVTGSPDADIYTQPTSAGASVGRAVADYNWPSIVFAAIIFFNVLAGILRRTKSWWLGGVIGAALGTVIGFIIANLIAGVILTIILTFLGLVFDYIVSKNGGNGPGSKPPFIFFGGFGGGNSSRGGFGGFGGGSSGGAGASGKW